MEEESVDLVTTILFQRIVATPGLEHFLDSIDLIADPSTVVI